MFWIICGIVAAVLYIYTVYKDTDEITVLDLVVATLIILLGWFALFFAIVMLVTNSEEISWADKLKNWVIYDKD